MPGKKYSQFTFVHGKPAPNFARLTRIAKPDIRIEFSSDFPAETRDAVHSFFFDREKKTIASSTLEWGTVDFPSYKSGNRSALEEGMQILCRVGQEWEKVLHFNNTVKPEQAKKRLYDKLTQTEITLLPHQEVLREEFRDYDWNTQTKTTQELYWTMGSGKTIGALAAISAGKHTSKDGKSSRVVIVCSNTLIGNWMKTIKEMPQIYGQTTFTIIGYAEFRKSIVMGSPAIENLSKCIVIVDEAHFYRNLTPSMLEDVALLRSALFLFLLTGTPIQNEPDEVTATLALLRCFDDKSGNFETNYKVLQKYRPEIEQKLEKMRNVFYYDPSVYDAAVFSEHYPQTEERIVRVPMSAIQALEYIMNTRSVTEIGPYSIQTARKDSYDSTTRGISNVIDEKNPQTSPKMCHIVKDILSGDYPTPHVIFSHYLEKGIYAIQNLLEQKTKQQNRQSRIETISGSIDGRKRDEIVAAYNTNTKIDQLFITDAAKEGVDLQGTGTMFIAESAQNFHGENQTMSRVARYGSHSKLPNDKQKVVFVKYRSIFPSVVAMEKQRKELEDYFENTYKLEARGVFDIVASLASLFKKSENGETVDEKYARNNLEKAKLLVPWLDMLKRVGDRKKEVLKMKQKREAEKPAENSRMNRVKKGALTLQELQKIRQEIQILPSKVTKRKADTTQENAKKRIKKNE